MKITELKNAPQWLRDAYVENENVEIVDGVIVWRGGEWRGGVWRGGEWCGGEWCGGERRWFHLGFDLRGYRFIAEFYDDVLHIKAGCRHFGLTESYLH